MSKKMLLVNAQRYNTMVDNCLRRQCKAVLLPISIAIYFAAQNLFDQILGVRPMNLDRGGIRAVRHSHADDNRNVTGKLRVERISFLIGSFQKQF